MSRIAFSILAAGLMSLAISGITQAAPMRPLPAAIGDTGITQVHYYHHWHHHHYWHRGGYPIAGFWNYYRTFGPGRGNSVESTR
jgi:hypothetical protein